MQYALLIYYKPGTNEALGADEYETVHREYLELKDTPGIIGGAALHPVETATTVRLRDDQLLVTQHGRDQLYQDWMALYKPEDGPALPADTPRRGIHATPPALKDETSSVAMFRHALCP